MLDHPVYVHRGEPRRWWGAEGEQILDEVTEPIDLFGDDVGELVQRWLGRQLRGEELRCACACGEGIVALVREAGDECAETGEALVPPRGLFETLLVAEVVNHDGHAANTVLAVPDRQTDDAHRKAAFAPGEQFIPARFALTTFQH